ncbi:MAG: SPOR domain-containing protein [Neisseria sp.]|nr:SPOR domain-containing protein [Neisseria sp.]
MNAKKQYGKGLSGFVLGLLLATLVIAGVLFFLNQSNKKAFKEEVQKELPPPPEVLTPKDSIPASAPQLPASGEEYAASDILGEFIEDQQASEVIIEQPAVTPAPPPARPAEPRAERPAKPAAKPAEKKAEPKPAAKPTPEQILNSGSIEKARKEAQTEQAKKPAEASSSGGRVIVQMGSFADRQSAEAHRAKLAMMGVSSNVSEATVNGKNVYRVQSGRLSKAEADSTRKTLQQNGVDSFARSVQ